MHALHPFVRRKSVAVLGEFVSLEEGTGIVHIAPGHGEDDYETGLKYGLDIYAPVDDMGKFKFPGAEQASPLQGKFVFKANAEIIDILINNNALMKEEKITIPIPTAGAVKNL
jgi:isoleucyl-tRNA synthetase